MCSINLKDSNHLSDQQLLLQARLYKSTRSREEFLAAYADLMATWQVEYESRFVCTEFGETHIIQSSPLKNAAPGSKPLVLIPGGQGTAGMWGPVMPTLCANHQTFSLDLIDQVGLSRPTRVVQTPEDSALWMAQALDALGLDEVNLMGNSIGSFIAAKFAHTHPARVNKLILTAPAATFARIRTGYILRVLLTLLAPFEWSKKRFLAYTANQRGDAKDPLNRLMTIAMSGTRVISKLTPAFFDDDELRSFAVQTLAVFGECDGVNSIGSKETMAKLERLNPDIRTAMIADAGHSFTPADFEYCAELADAFLSVNPD